jgi:hypothetical protein
MLNCASIALHILQVLHSPWQTTSINVSEHEVMDCHESGRRMGIYAG